MSNYPSRSEFMMGEKAQLTRTITEADIVAMADITGDTNPVHMDEEFAARTRFKGRIAHGVFSAGLISAVLGTQLPGPGAVYLKQTLNFLSPVRAGDTINAEVEVIGWRADKRIVTLKTIVSNQADQNVADGEAVLLMDEV